MTACTRAVAKQIERALGGRWNDGRRPGVHVTSA